MPSTPANDKWRFWLKTEHEFYEIKDVKITHIAEGFVFNGTFEPGFAIPFCQGLLVERNGHPLHTFEVSEFWHPLLEGDEFDFNFTLRYE